MSLALLTLTSEGFAFDQKTGESYTLNSCGQLILQLLQQGHEHQQISQLLADEFGIARSTIDRDVHDFLQQLHTLGLLGSRS